MSWALEIGMAKPIPSTSVEAVLAALMPMTFPLKSMSAPPLLPGLMAASVWMKVLLIPFSSVISRSHGDGLAVSKGVSYGDDLLSHLDII